MASESKLSDSLRITTPCIDQSTESADGGGCLNFCTSRKNAYIILTPLNATFVQ